MASKGLHQGLGGLQLEGKGGADVKKKAESRLHYAVYGLPIMGTCGIKSSFHPQRAPYVNIL